MLIKLYKDKEGRPFDTEKVYKDVKNKVEDKLNKF